MYHYDFSSPINLQNGWQQILYLSEIAEVSNWIEFVFSSSDKKSKYHHLKVALNKTTERSWVQLSQTLMFQYIFATRYRITFNISTYEICAIFAQSI